MAPVAAAVLVEIAVAMFVGFLVGALGGTIVFRARAHLLVGGLLVFGAYLLILVLEHRGALHPLSREILVGGPSAALGFLASSLIAHWLERLTSLRPTWIALLALVSSLVAGSLYLRSFRASPWSPVQAALAADVGLLLLLVWSVRLSRRSHPMARR